jgi:hypothetical protein
MSDPSPSPGLRTRLAAIGAFADELAAEGFVVGQWRGGDQDADGVIQMPWFELSERALAFVSALGGILEVFDWPAWAATDEAKRLYTDRDALAVATPEQLSKLATSLIRSERFNDGELSAAFESGVMAAIARRAAALAADTPAHPR